MQSKFEIHSSAYLWMYWRNNANDDAYQNVIYFGTDPRLNKIHSSP